MSENGTLDTRHNGQLVKAVPDPEVHPRAKHRHFTADYKQQILDEVATCTKRGKVGALLRREGLYSSHLSKWRQQQAAGAWHGLQPKKRGPKVDPQAQELQRLQCENHRLQERLQKAELIIEVQKKVSLLLGVKLESPPEGELSS